MYSIRALAVDEVLEVVFSGGVPTREALRAISQAGAIAAAGSLQRSLVDTRNVQDGFSRGSLPLLAATLAPLMNPETRVAILCTEAQLPFARGVAHFTGAPGLGVFTRESDARHWLAGAHERRLPATTLRHIRELMLERTATPRSAETERQRRTA